MTPEDKQLLLRDLCARLPYKPMIRLDFQPGHGYQEGKMEISNFWDIVRHFENGIIATIKPYLRPLSSMTDDERKELSTVLNYEFYVDDDFALVAEDDRHRIRLELCEGYIDWLLAHHFDFRGLIDKGLALEALKGMYNSTNNA